jgi:O-antigen/teichoic acid export membrane protein
LNIYKICVSTLKFVGAFLLVKYITNDIFHFFIYQLSIGIIEFLVIRYKVYSLLPTTNFIMPSLKILRKILPFALTLSSTSFAWILFTQVDKFLLSHYIPLSEYGYFTLVSTIAGGIMQISLPLTQAISPRMTALIAENKISEMLKVYHSGTKVLAVVSISVVSIISFFSYELLYIWTDDVEASKWAAPILIWYVLGNGIVAIWSIQHYLQYAYGNLKYEIKFYMILLPVSLPVVYFSVINHGALGAGIALFIMLLLVFLFWAPFIHHKFAPGIHIEWIVKDILPALVMSAIFITILRIINIDVLTYTRLESLLILLILGSVLLLSNMLVYKEVRMKLTKIFRG